MTTDTLYYGGVINGQFLAVWQDAINVWMEQNLDNQVARQVTEITRVDSTVEQYEISKIDFTGDDVVPKAKNAPGEELTLGAATEMTPLWRWSEAFTIHEDDLKKSPTLRTRYVEACIAKIFRGEDKVWYNGRSVNNITGMKTTAEANTNGKVVASGATGSDTNNIGAWLTSDTNRDIYEDLRVARGKLDSKYRNNLRNLYLVGNASSMDALFQKDPYSDASTLIAQSVAPLFGRTGNDPVGSWAVINDQIDSGYVFLVSKNREAAEIIQATTPTIDDNYPRKPIGNLEVHIYQDVGIAFHDPNAFVEIAIT
jgi:hypothetical protein